jgi:hypothetical protein
MSYKVVSFFLNNNMIFLFKMAATFLRQKPN